MKEIQGNLFFPPYEVDTICITTNGVIDSKENAVMGRGVAKIIRDMYPLIAFRLGQEIKEKGNIVLYLGKFYINERDRKIFSFPTKNHWREKADIKLIQKSAHFMKTAADIFNLRNIWLPPPGCGLGGLNWEDVKPKIEKILDERFTIVFLKEESENQCLTFS
jgi:hypothetical protein